MPSDLELVLFPVWPEPVTLLIGLASLAILLAIVRIRDGGLLEPIRRTLAYRLALAAIAGWLAAWCLLPLSFFPVPENRSGFFTPGAIFGLFVLVPLLDRPARHPWRAAMSIWAAAVAYAMLWFSGIWSIRLLEAFSASFPGDAEAMPPLLAAVMEPSIVGAPAGMVLATIVGLTAWRLLGPRAGPAFWLRLLILGGVGGTAYAAVLLQSWFVLINSFEFYTFQDAALFLVHVLWYAAFALVLSVRSPAPAKSLANTDYLLLGGLALLTVLAVGSLVLELFPIG